MKITSQRIALLLVLTFMAQMLTGCDRTPVTISEYSPAPGDAAPAPGMIETPNPAYAFAQATTDFGKNQLAELSRKSTEVSLDMAQAAKAAAVSTQDYNRRLKMELDFQATAVSSNITQAAVTLKFLAQQTKMSRDATTAAQNSAAAATHAAYLVHETQTAHAQVILNAEAAQTVQAAATLTAYPLTATYAAYEQNVTQTAQAQVILNAWAAQTAQANAALTAYPLTATPFAVTQAALLMKQYDREQQSFVDQVVAPLIPILAILDLLLFILLLVLAYRRRFLTKPQPAPLLAAHAGNPGPLNMIDGEIIDHELRIRRIIPAKLKPANSPQLPGENTVYVEIVNPTDPPPPIE